MSLGLYNEKYFENNPEQANKPGALYCIVLVNKKTDKRECVKIGITQGTANRDVIKRTFGFKGYEPRIQKTVFGTLEEVYHLEQWLHELWQDHRYYDSHRFGGHTELFKIDKLHEILKSIPSKV